jgi:Regulator of chromosome condensation (RCC1) repeat
MNMLKLIRAWRRRCSSGGSRALALPTSLPVFTDTSTGVVDLSPTIAAGEAQSLVLKQDGSLWSFSHNGDGQLGRNRSDGSFAVTVTPAKVMTGVAAVAAGDRHGLVLKADGSLWSYRFQRERRAWSSFPRCRRPRRLDADAGHNRSVRA